MGNKNQKELIQTLIVEDDPFYRDSLQNIINDDSNIACKHACESCEEAIKILASGFLPQVILLDIQLPGMSGIDGIKELRALSPVTQIIILTVFDDDDKVFNALCQGAIGYLLKSSPAEKIRDAIKQVSLGGAAMSPLIAAKVLKLFNQYSQPRKEYKLTQREREILKLLIEGKSKREIADLLFISLLTVDTHFKNIYSKLHVHTQIDLVSKVIKEKLV